MTPPGAVPHSPGDPLDPTPAGPPPAGRSHPHDSAWVSTPPAGRSHPAGRPLGPASANPVAAGPGALGHPLSPAAVGPLTAGPGTFPLASRPTSSAAAELPEWERLRVLRAESEFESVRKNARVAYLLWAVCGIFGGHRFYLGDTGRSIAMLFTLGGLGVWTLADLFFVGRRVRAVNRARRAEIMARHALIDA
ncbi:TM2 domain-containing protein [Actinoplanes sp. TRM 88003]|uniref:TM2 domain-containing protein n=1 Tax=Paractinoplanes aksuensis TaxID=2939490 RepID=A0ABT1DQL0_9ACTN|nr:TM2 domain-containing protein [Actinoplanes aksuensis]MCO8273136.1 TM2 domain-containing protein [Actinoplanes aksuensis]